MIKYIISRNCSRNLCCAEISVVQISARGRTVTRATTALLLETKIIVDLDEKKCSYLSSSKNNERYAGCYRKKGNSTVVSRDYLILNVRVYIRVYPQAQKVEMRKNERRTYRERSVYKASRYLAFNGY